MSFTFDMWTSNQKLGYMTLTTHYIDEKFILKKKILNFKKASYPHTTYMISDAIWNCILEWELDDRVLTLAVDNASNNDGAITKLRKNHDEKMMFSGFYMKDVVHIS